MDAANLIIWGSNDTEMRNMACFIMGIYPGPLCFTVHRFVNQYNSAEYRNTEKPKMEIIPDMMNKMARRIYYSVLYTTTHHYQKWFITANHSNSHLLTRIGKAGGISHGSKVGGCISTYQRTTQVTECWECLMLSI